ncbi:hypothetical protein ACFQBQ_16290 [Granulicella cerasi]|uniref:Major facilitator superfamily (MFS) profile domain-containing protein n=1 Tax=Granulicella cerasi TaxID=741063 RepID=A0ABW1ZFA2_9BACT|nr:hypothetical protein [Granulicella cerasi]
MRKESDILLQSSREPSIIPASNKPNWAGVASLFVGVFGLVASEFAPAGLLTPMATDLGITQGMAGQAISANAIIGLVVSLLISVMLRSLDRKLAVILFPFCLPCPT